MAKATRREFARLAAAVPIAAAVVLPASGTQAAPATAPVLTPPPEPIPLSQALTSVVGSEYGSYLTPEELARIRKDFEDSAVAIQRLRSFDLRNADEPDFTFTVLVTR